MVGGLEQSHTWMGFLVSAIESSFHKSATDAAVLDVWIDGYGA